MVEDKILNNSYDEVEYGTERTTQAPIAISPLVAGNYEDSTSENIESVYTARKLRSEMSALYETSPFYETYGQIAKKKIKREDMVDVYCYFKSKLNEIGGYSLVEILCAIAEFFDMNYKTLYNDVISLEDKVAVLESLEETYGLKKRFTKSKKLF